MSIKIKNAFYNLVKKYPQIIKDEITVSGNSMFPTLVDGEKVKIDTKELNDIKVGDIILYRYFSAHLTVHRVVGFVNKNNNVYYLTKGDNNSAPDNYLVPMDSIIGKLIR